MLESKKIRMTKTKVDDISSIIMFEDKNQEYIRNNNFEEHKRLVENNDTLHLSFFNKNGNKLIGHIILAGLNKPNNSVEFRRIVISNKGYGLVKIL